MSEIRHLTSENTSDLDIPQFCFYRNKLRILLPSQSECKLLIKDSEKHSNVILKNTKEELVRNSVILFQERIWIAAELRVIHWRMEVKQDSGKLLIAWNLSFLCTEWGSAKTVVCDYVIEDFFSIICVQRPNKG